MMTLLTDITSNNKYYVSIYFNLLLKSKNQMNNSNNEDIVKLMLSLID